jgi:hypothetical protein
VVYFRLFGDVLYILDLEVFGVVVRVFEDQLLPVQIDLRNVFQLALVIEKRVVRVHHDFELFGVEFVWKTEFRLYQSDLARALSNHKY